MYPTNSWIGCRLSLLRVQPASLRKRFDGFVVEMLDDLDRQLDAVLVVGQRSKAVVGVDVTNRNAPMTMTGTPPLEVWIGPPLVPPPERTDS